jgi:hypothetical protein
MFNNPTRKEKIQPQPPLLILLVMVCLKKYLTLFKKHFWRTKCCTLLKGIGFLILPRTYGLGDWSFNSVVELCFQINNIFQNAIITNMVKKTMERHAFLILAEAITIITTFDLWMSQGGLIPLLWLSITSIRNGNHVM